MVGSARTMRRAAARFMAAVDLVLGEFRSRKADRNTSIFRAFCWKTQPSARFLLSSAAREETDGRLERQSDQRWRGHFANAPRDKNHCCARHQARFAR